MSGLDVLKDSLTQELLNKMRANNMNQDNLATNTKFTPADISKILSKQKNCTLKTIAELAEGLNCNAKITFTTKINNHKS